MELKEGYKQTEVGVIPEDWEVRKLGDFSPFITSGSRGWAMFYNDIGAPFLRITNMFRNTIKLDLSDLKLVNLPDNENEGKRTQLQSGDILISITADIGIVSYVDDSVPKPAYISQHVALVRFKDANINSQFVSYFLASANAQKNFISSTDGGAKAGMSLTGISKINFVKLPTLEEQTAIATALSDADALISRLETLIDKKRAIKQGAMQQLLKPKEGWVVKTIRQLADYKKELFDDGDWVEAEHITSEGVRLIQTGNIGITKFVEKSDKKYIFEESFEKLKCKSLIKGDLLICRLAEPAGRACILPDIGEEKVITSVDVSIFRPRAEVANRVFLSYIFSTDDWFKAVSELCGGTTHKRISRGALGKISIVMPSDIREQTRIAQILSDMDAEITGLEQKLSKYKRVKQGMMQELLTGKTRLV